MAFGENDTLRLRRRSLGEHGVRDEIVVTELDHHGNVAPWRALARARGVTLRWLAMSRTLRARAANLERAITRARGFWRLAPRPTRSARSEDVEAGPQVAIQVGACVVDACIRPPASGNVAAGLRSLALPRTSITAASKRVYGRSMMMRWTSRARSRSDGAPERLEDRTQNTKASGAARFVDSGRWEWARRLS